MTVAVEWRADVRPVVGPGYVNTCAHVLVIGRVGVAALHAYEDSQAVADACRLMASQGVVEAEVAPIESLPGQTSPAM